MKKIISIALAVLMVVSLLPLTAFAGNTEKLAVAQLRTALINGGLVKGLDAADNSLAAVKALFANDAEKISAFNGSTELSDSDLVGTGTEIRLTVNSTVTDSVTAILYGDVNGDGVINDDDFDLIVDEAIMGTDSLEDGSVYEKAADTNNDGVIDGFDLALVDLESNGFAAIDQRGDLPAALVEEIDKATVGTNGVVTIGGEDITVDTAFELTATQTADEIENKEYKDWNVDLAISFNKDVDGSKVYLAGQYGSYEWLGGKLSNGAIAAGEKVSIVNDWLGESLTYEDIVTSVQSMKAALYVEDAAAGLKATIDVVMTDASTGDSFVVSSYTYKFSDQLPEAVIDEIDESTVGANGDGQLVGAATGDAVTADAAIEIKTNDTPATVADMDCRYWDVDIVISFNKDVNGNDVYLFGDYGTYSWVGDMLATAPAYDGNIAAGTEIALIKDWLGAVLGRTDLSVNYNDVVTSVGAMKSAIFVDEAEDGLTVSVKLVMTDPDTGVQYDISTYSYTYDRYVPKATVVDIPAKTVGDNGDGKLTGDLTGTQVDADVAINVVFDDTPASVAEKQCKDWQTEIEMSFNKPVDAADVYVFGKYGTYGWMGDSLSIASAYQGTIAAGTTINLVNGWFSELMGVPSIDARYEEIIARQDLKDAALHVNNPVDGLTVTVSIVLTNPDTGEKTVIASGSYTYVVIAEPTVVKIDEDVVGTNNDGKLTGDISGAEVDADVAIEVTIPDTPATIAEKEYKDWETEVEMSFNKPVNAEDVYVFGEYGTHGWMGDTLAVAPGISGTIPADSTIALAQDWFTTILGVSSLELPYEAVVARTGVKKAALHVENPVDGLTVKVSIILTNPDTGERRIIASDSYTYVVIAEPEVNFIGAANVGNNNDGKLTGDLSGDQVDADVAVNVVFADTPATIADKQYKDWQTEIEMSFNKPVDAADVYVFGKYDAYNWMGDSLSIASAYTGLIPANTTINLVNGWFAELMGVPSIDARYEDVIARQGLKDAALHVNNPVDGLTVTVAIVLINPDTNEKMIVASDTYTYVVIAEPEVNFIGADNVGNNNDGKLTGDISGDQVDADVAVNVVFADTPATIVDKQYKDWQTEVEMSFNMPVNAEDVYVFGKYGSYDWMGDSLSIASSYSGEIAANQKINLLSDWFAELMGVSAIDAKYEDVIARQGLKDAALHVNNPADGLTVTVSIVLTNPATGEKMLVATDSYTY